MSDAMNLFLDSYIKGMKRPELMNYSPDQSYGANLLHGSENTNPWANRDNSNAKFGQLGGNVKPVYGPSPSMEENNQLKTPFFNTQPTPGSLSTFVRDISGPMSQMGGQYLAKEGFDKFKQLLTGGKDIIAEAANAPAAGADVASQTSQDTIGGFNLPSMGLNIAPQVIQLLSGSKTAGAGVNAGIQTGMALGQGGMNPISDLSALYSLFKFGRSLF